MWLVLSARAMQARDPLLRRLLGGAEQGFLQFPNDSRNSCEKRDVPIISRLHTSTTSSWALLILREHCLPYEPTALAAPQGNPLPDSSRSWTWPLFLVSWCFLLFPPSFDHIPLPDNVTFQGPAAAPVFFPSAQRHGDLLFLPRQPPPG